MLQHHNSIGQNNTEQNKMRQNNIWIGDSHRKTSQHRPFFSHHKSVFPTQKTLTGTPTYTPQHAPQYTRTPACTTPSQASAPPSCILPPFRLPPFPKAPLPMLLANRHQQSSCKKNSMKSKLFGNKPPLPHRHPNSCPNKVSPNRTPACTTLSDIHPTFLHPSSFPPSSFFSRHHFPCSWQTNTNTAISERFE